MERRKSDDDDNDESVERVTARERGNLEQEQLELEDGKDVMSWDAIVRAPR